MSSYSIGLGFAMLLPVSRKSRELVHELEVPSGSSFKTNAVVHAFIQQSYDKQFEGDSRFTRGTREICENRSHDFSGFVLFNPLRTNFGACNKFTTGQTVDYVN